MPGKHACLYSCATAPHVNTACIIALPLRLYPADASAEWGCEGCGVSRHLICEVDETTSVMQPQARLGNAASDVTKWQDSTFLNEKYEEPLWPFSVIADLYLILINN